MNLVDIIKKALGAFGKQDEERIPTYTFEGEGSYKESPAYKQVQGVMDRASATFPSPDPAFDPKQVYDENGRLKDEYRKPKPTAMPTTMPTPPNAVPTITPQGNYNWEELQDYFAGKAKELGYDTATLVSQKAYESDRGKSPFALKRNNFGGIGAYDHDPNQALTFKDVDDYMQYYDRMIQKNFPNAYKVRSDGSAYLDEILKGGRIGVYATDPDYKKDVQNTPEYRKYKGR